MADCDAKIMVGTKVDTSQMQKLQIQIDKATQKVESLAARLEEVKNKKIPTEDYTAISNQIEKAEARLTKLTATQDRMIALGRDSGASWDKIQYDIEEVRNELHYAKGDLQELVDTGKAFTIGGSRDEIAAITNQLSMAQAELNALNTRKVELLSKEFDKASKSSKKCFKTIQDGSKKSNGLLSVFASRLRGIALSLLVFNWITKGFNAMVKSMREGFHNLAQYSNEYNASMSALKSQTEQLKNSLATAFEPIVNMAIPYITKLVGWLNTAADAMAQFFAVLQGKTTYTKAKKQVIDYAKSLDTASKSAKGALASFDRLNVLNKDNGSVSSGGGALTGADAFETAEISSGMNSVLTALQPFRDILSGLANDIDLEPLLDSFERLRISAEPFGTYLYEGLLWFLNDILVPFSEWTIEDAIPAFLDLLSAALDLLSVIIEKLKPYGIWLWDEFLQPLAGWVADKLIEGIDAVTKALEDFSSWCKGNKDGVDLMSSIILGFFAGIIIYYIIKKIVTVIGAIKDACQKFIKTVSGGISPIKLAAIAIAVLAAGIIYLASNWDKLSGAQKAITILGALAAAAIAAAVAIAVFHTAWSVGIAAAAIVGGLALLGLTTACLKSNGNTSESTATSFYNGNDFSSSPLPMLANGAVIQGGRPFAAILGDQPAGQTNIESPLSTIEDAVQNVYDRNGGTGEINLNIYLDGEPVYKSVVKQDRMHQKATGHSAFAY